MRKNKSLIFFEIIISLCFYNCINAGCSGNMNKDSLNIIELKKFYNGKGVIFSKDNPYYGADAKDKLRFTPTISEVIEAEIILDSLVNIYFNKDTLERRERKLKLRNYYRQYVGYKDKNEQKIIVMRILNFGHPDSKKYFKGWDKSFIINTGDFYALYTRIYFINISKKQLQKGSYQFDWE